MQIRSFEYNFLGFGIHPSKCIIEIRDGEKESFITFIDTGEGTSVTNDSERLANETKLLAKNKKVRFFERYIKLRGKNTYDEITYQTNSLGEFSKPQWTNLTEEKYIQIIT